MHYAIERSVTASCSPEAVLRRILDPATWAEWQHEIVGVTGPPQLEKDDVVRGAAKLLGFHVHGISMAVDVAPNSFEEDVVVGVRMRIRYEVTPDENGTVIVHRLHMDLPEGLSGTILSWFLRRRLSRMQRLALRRLADQSAADDSA